MTNNFIPKFYPKTVSKTSFEQHLINVGTVYRFKKYSEITKKNCINYLYSETKYKNFDFNTYIPFFLFSNGYESNKSHYIIDNSFKKIFYGIIELFEKYTKGSILSKITHSQKNDFIDACIENYKNVDIKKYYLFLKKVICFKKFSTKMEYKPYNTLYGCVDLWFGCFDDDLHMFIENLNTIDIEEFYKELKRIEENYIEFLI